jgi:DHA1 family tetracycline resistance protein-like MFS transporter
MPSKPPNVLAFVCLILFLDALGVGLILPVTPDLITQLTDLPNARAAEITGYLMFAFAGAQFFFAPILGGLSDQYGRRPVLLLALGGFVVNYFLMAAAPTLFWLFVARVFSGLCGATIPTANASLVDVTPGPERGRAFGLTGAALGLGFIMGPPVGGLLGEVDYRLPFLAAGACTLAVLVYGYFTFGETLPAERQRTFDWKRANPLGSVLQVARYPFVLALLAAFFCVQLSSQAHTTIWAFYTIEVADWSKWAIGISAGFYGLMMVLVQGALTGPLIKRFGEWRALWLSLGAALLSYLGLAFATGPVGIYAAIVVGGFAGLFFPAIQTLMTRAIPENAQGELQGAVASSFCVAAIIGPIVMAHLFSSFVDGVGPRFPGAPFIAATALVLCAAAVLARWGRRHAAAQA